MTRGRRAGKARTLKIVVAGPFAAGKTTLVRTISEITVLSTERDVSDDTRQLKGQTTVAMDYGRVSVTPDAALYLFGTPGQDRFEFMWDILAEGMLGFVLVVDLEREDSLDEAARILRVLRDAAPVPFVVAANKVAGRDQQEVDALVRTRLGLAAGTRVVACDVRERESVKEVLVAFLLAVRDGLVAAPAAVAREAR